MNVPSGMLYSKEHEWILLEDTIATVGITDFAQHQLGDIVYVDIPAKEKLTAGDTFGTVEAVKTVSDLFAPLTGTILSINPALESEPDLVNTDPYGKGWMIKIQISNPEEAGALMNSEAYLKLVS